MKLSYQFVVILLKSNGLVICESQQEVVQMTTTRGQAVSLKAICFPYHF